VTRRSPIEELDYRDTPMGALMLRRRTLPGTDTDVFEVKLGDDFLMSSQFTAGEIALADLGLKACAHAAPEIVIGGLGLGYSAMAALQFEPRIASLLVIERYREVIDWHRRHLVPLGAALTADPRCTLREADFFALLNNDAPCLDTEAPARKFHAVLLDIDHAPTDLLAPAHAEFYTKPGLARLAAQLHEGGVFALWSNEPPEPDFLDIMRAIFPGATAREVEFPHGEKHRTATNTIYIGRKQS
jgi:spermidine synthase